MKEVKFNWLELIGRYQLSIANHGDLEGLSDVDLVGDIVDALRKVLIGFISSQKIRDQWSEARWSKTSFGIYVSKYSETQGVEYDFGVYGDEIYISARIAEPQCLKNVSNEFWGVLSNLALSDGFSFQSNAGLLGGWGRDFDLKGGGSVVYELMRNYILLVEHDPDGVCDIGSFEFKWKALVSLEDLLLTGGQVFKKIHRLNYLLYRCGYLKNRSRK